MKKADILIKNGRVVDPHRGIDAAGTVAVAGGRIVDAAEYADADQTVDAAGCVVCPGLIDYHAHVASVISEMAVDPMAVSFPFGVTTVVDAGSAGTANYEVFRAHSAMLPVRIPAMLHVAPEGNVTTLHSENQDPACWNRPAIRRLLRKYPADLVGLKIRLDRRVLGGLDGARVLDSALELAEETGSRLICHVTNPPFPMNELAARFRPGDVFTHVFHGVENTILDANGSLLPGLLEAQGRGVLMDACNGMRNFSIPVALAGLRAGLLPDIISTDLTGRSAFVRNDNVESLPLVMSKYLAFGMSLPEVLRRVTETPARTLGLLPEIGTLAPGSCADVAILRVLERPVLFRDATGGSFGGGQLIKPEMTIRAGACVYSQVDFQRG